MAACLCKTVSHCQMRNARVHSVSVLAFSARLTGHVPHVEASAFGVIQGVALAAYSDLVL